MTIKVLFTYDYGKENMDKVKNIGYDVKIENENKVRYTDDLKEVKALVCYNPFKTLDITKMKNLEWIQLSSAGIDQLPMKYAARSGILITNNKGGYSIPIGEWIVLKILELLKHSKKLYKNQENKIWKMDSSITELFGKTIGFIGTGNIAKEAAKRLKSFGVEILGTNTTGRIVDYFDRCFSSNNIDEMLKISDIVVVTIPYTKETHHFLDEEKFKKMKQGVYIVNIARGSIIEQNSLIDNIKNGKVAGAALDVVEEEPLDTGSCLWNLPNVIITPHNSWISEMRNIRRFNLIFDNLKRFKNGDKLINVVDLQKGY